ncbi:histidine phosphatase family protein [Alicyclobacillus sp. ALC3]|uniref:histidine phosphatase family protein n=1 Tax=Alicyclobacillus sp. ALC3 TaxID=2796143 RepID=UPI002377E1E7|nr:histidine phosphatase family protein [Alicyclobacillus sp. ALC3]WDL96445.1 histidine phosphatase family protein [Alicyclobacillus sp. ALC3]
MKHIYIVRHCSAEGQSSDAPLTREGTNQAELLADFLEDRHIDKILSSPYARAMTSIEPLAQGLRLQIHEDPRLSERVLSSEPLHNWLDCLEQTFADFELAYNGGETSAQAMNRAIQVVNEVLAGSHHDVVIVTHGNLMTLMLRHFDERFGIEAWAALTNPDVYRITVDESETTVERVWR